MTRPRGRADVAVVGGGVVGTAAALVLARIGLDVVLVEASHPPPWHADRQDLRVYAIAPDNVDLLEALGIWAGIAAARAQPYRRMRVWDAAGGGELAFDADAFGRRELGWIVEHGLLVDRLWTKAEAAGVRVRCPASVIGLQQDTGCALLALDDGSRVEANLAIAADGAESTLRQLAGIGITRREHGQRAIVAYVNTARSHEDTAWQRFLPGGPLALLPFVDPPARQRGHAASIVWTLPDAEAHRLLAVDAASFESALERAFDGRLGPMQLQSERAAFPLRRQLARDYMRDRVLVLGDAAHVVHPLAGQGVNLGLRDVMALRDSVRDATSRGIDWSSTHRLARWARARRSENAISAHAFDAMNWAFSSDAVALTVLRGPLLGLAGRMPGLPHAFWRRASGG